MLLFILLVVVVSIGILLYIRSKNVKETFRSNTRKDMDDVLDNYCSITAPTGYDNYEGPWVNDKYYNPTNPRCGKHSCSKETCYSIEKDKFNFSNPEAYIYVPSTSPLTRTEEVDNEVDEETQVVGITCTTKHNPSTNVYCEPNDIPHCEKYMYNVLAHHFNSNNLRWEEKYINTFMNSNGECHLRNANYPYEIVNFKRTSDKSFIQTSNSLASNVVYKDSGPTCQLRPAYPGSLYYDDDNGDNHYLNPTKFDRFDARTNSFICKSGSSKRYGHTSNNNHEYGFTCGWLTNDCVECQPEKHECHVFDTNERVYNTKNFFQVYFDHDGDGNPTNKACNKYLVNDNMTSIFKSTNPYELAESPNTLDRMLIRNGNVAGEGHTVTKDSVPNCIDTITDCSDSRSICYELGANVNSTAKSHFANKHDTPYNTIPFDNKIVPVEYNRRYNSAGDACEYCIWDSDNNTCFTDSTTITTAIPTCKNEYEVQCPKGYELREDIVSGKYCDVCGQNQYYDETESNCKDLDGCPAGQYFDALNNVSSSFKMYSLSLTNTSTDITTNAALGTVSYTSYNNNDYAFLDNNTDIQCVNCTGSNMYMDEAYNTKFSCETCPLQDDIGYIMTTSTSRDKCNRCVIADYTDTSPNPKYVQYTDTHRKCMECPSLPSDDDQKDFTHVESITPSSGTGKCYRKCDAGLVYNNITLTGGDEDYDEINSKYPYCDFTCPDNHIKSGSTCSPCPAGTQNLNGTATCSPCPEGTYNNVAGNYCVACPSGIDGMRLQPVTTVSTNADTTGSTNVSSCQIQCINSDVNVQYGTNGYNLNNCPKESCDLPGYTKSNLVGDTDQNVGYNLVNITGEKNVSLNPNECITTTPRSSIVNGCESGFTEHNSSTEKVCCRNGLIYNTTSKKCECGAKHNYHNPPLYDMTHVNTVKYYPLHGTCVPETCKGNSTDITGGGGLPCVLNCGSGKYKDISTSACIDCTKPANVATMITRGSGTSQNDCLIESCDTGYSKSPDGKSCIEDTENCEYKVLVSNGSSMNNLFNAYNAIPNGISVNNGVLPSFYKVETSVETTSECANKQNTTVCANGTFTEINATHNVSACCINANGTFKTTNDYAIIDDDSIARRNGKFSKRKGACCPNNSNLKVSLFDSQEYYGCCQNDETLMVNANNETKCCPSPTTSTYYKLNTDNPPLCEQSCKNGYTKNTNNECVEYTDCPNSVYNIKRVKDFDPTATTTANNYYTDINGAYIVYSSNVGETIGTCETNISKFTTDSSVNNKCISVPNTSSLHDDDYHAYCCVDAAATFHNGETICSKPCDSYDEWTKDGDDGDYTITYTKTNVSDTRASYIQATNNYQSCPTGAVGEEVPVTIPGYMKEVSADNNVVTFRKSRTVDCYQIHGSYDSTNDNADYYAKTTYTLVDTGPNTSCPSGTSSDITCGDKNTFTSNNIEMVACCENTATFDSNNEICKCPTIWTSNYDNHLTTYTSSENCDSDNSVGVPPTDGCVLDDNDDPNIIYCCDAGYNITAVNVDTPTCTATPALVTPAPAPAPAPATPEEEEAPVVTEEAPTVVDFVWTSNIKPRRFVGYDEDATIYHYITSNLNSNIDNGTSPEPIEPTDAINPEWTNHITNRRYVGYDDDAQMYHKFDSNILQTLH